MKTLLIILCGSLLAHPIYAQSLDRSVIGATGIHAVSTSYELEFTAGESIIGQGESTSFFLNQGFHQGDGFVSTALEKPLIQIDYQLFPNPTRDWINLEVEMEKAVDLNIDLLDLQGRKTSIPSQRLSHTQSGRIRMNLEALPSGIYLLQVFDSTGQVIKSLRIQKVE